MGETRLRRIGRWFSTTTWGSARWQRVLTAAFATVVFWPHSSVDAAVGLDPSWQAGLALAWTRDLAWGPEVVFTAGPWGFLRNTPLYAFDQAVLATLYQVAVVGALFLGVAAVLRQRHAPLPSLLGAFLLTGFVNTIHIGQIASLGMLYPELAVLAAFTWACLPLLQQQPKNSTVLTTCIVLSIVASFQLMVKFNTGINILVIAVAMSLLLDVNSVVRHVAIVAMFALTAIIWWVLAGQSLGDLPEWLISSGLVLSGYVDAQSFPLQMDTIPAVVLFVLWIAVLGAAFVWGSQKLPRRFVVLVALTTLIVAKSAFGRYDPPHFSILFGPILVAIAITPISFTRRMVAATTVSCFFAYLVGPSGVHTYHSAANDAPRQAIDRLITLAVPSRVEQRIERAKARQRAEYGIPERFIETIGAGTVHIDPTEISAVWAYNFAWRPAPVFQAYSAYIPELDKLNSDMLARGPQFVLSAQSLTSPATTIDSRLEVQESPLYSRALLCDYGVSGIENHWALFTRTHPHCGTLKELSEVTVHSGDSVKVPAATAPNTAVLMAIDIDRSVLDRLFQGLVIPLTVYTLVVDGVVHRLVTANAAEPFLINSPSSVNGTNLEIHPHTLSIGRYGELFHGDVRAKLRFFEMQVDR